MKRKVLALLICAMLCLCFVSCGSDGDGDGSASARDIFYIEYNNVKVELGAKADGVLPALGEATSVKSVGNCGGLGEQIKYTYPSIVIYTLKADGEETLDQIDLLDDLVTTSEGIYIGSAKADVESAYGTPDKSSDSSLQYSEGNCYLAFGLNGGEVVSITLMRETN